MHGMFFFNIRIVNVSQKYEKGDKQGVNNLSGLMLLLNTNFQMERLWICFSSKSTCNISGKCPS